MPETIAFTEKPPSAAEKYPAPKKHPTFIARWNEFIGDVVARENFKVGHLSQLLILCDLYVEYDKLIAILEDQGYSFFAQGGRNGPQLKKRPELEQLNRTRAEIRSYSKMLGLLLVNDKDRSGDTDEEEQWD